MYSLDRLWLIILFMYQLIELGSILLGVRFVVCPPDCCLTFVGDALNKWVTGNKESLCGLVFVASLFDSYEILMSCFSEIACPILVYLSLIFVYFSSIPTLGSDWLSMTLYMPLLGNGLRSHISLNLKDSSADQGLLQQVDFL
jgi:hypothetical protein